MILLGYVVFTRPFELGALIVLALQSMPDVCDHEPAEILMTDIPSGRPPRIVLYNESG
jgi:hypothetical protein